MDIDADTSAEIPEDMDEETTPDEQEVEEDPDPESIQRAREKLEDNAISDELRHEVQERLEEWDASETEHERDKIEDALDRITYDGLDENLRAARDHLAIVNRYCEEAPDSSMERVRWERIVDEEREQVRDLEKKVESFKTREREQLNNIEADLSQGRIDEQEAERRFDRIREQRKKLQRSTTFSAAGIDDLDETMWEQRMLPRRAMEPDVVEKASKLREQLENLPWHEREEVLREMAERAEIDEETLREIEGYIS